MIPIDGPIPAAGTYIYDLPGALMRPGRINYSMDLTVSVAGATIDNFLQTSFDGGKTWRDVANLVGLLATINKTAVLTKEPATAVQTAASDGALADDTIVNGLFGYNWRIKQVVVGAYTGNIRLNVDFRQF